MTWVMAGVAVSMALAGCSTQQAVESPPTSASASAGQPSSGSSPAELGASQHTNSFDLAPAKGVTAIAFTWDGIYAISSGQESTWGGVTSQWNGQGDPPSLDIQVKAGRKASPDVYAWYAQRAQQFSCTVAVSGNTAPDGQELGCATDNLNFAFTGTLTINGTGYPVVIGQGWLSGNAWFYGGAGWQGPDTTTGAFTTPDGRYALVPQGLYQVQVVTR